MIICFFVLIILETHILDSCLLNKKNACILTMHKRATKPVEIDLLSCQNQESKKTRSCILSFLEAGMHSGSSRGGAFNCLLFKPLSQCAIFSVT